MVVHSNFFSFQPCPFLTETPTPKMTTASRQTDMGMLLGLVHEAVEAAGPNDSITWRDVDRHLLERCTHPTAGPMVFKLTEYFRHADISFLVRDSEKREKPHDGWKLFQYAHRLARSTMFTNNNAHKYIRIGNDEQVDMDTRSDFLDYVWGSVIFLEGSRRTASPSSGTAGWRTW